MMFALGFVVGAVVGGILGAGALLLWMFPGGRLY